MRTYAQHMPLLRTKQACYMIARAPSQLMYGAAADLVDGRQPVSIQQQVVVLGVGLRTGRKGAEVGELVVDG